MASWKSQPIFVSSTFADMQAERDHMRSFVFPAIEERLKARRSHLEWVDLRLGVATASLVEGEARELQVLKVCLAEVRRCRPFLIVLLGDRYGWVPPDERIVAAAREEGIEDDVVGRSVTDLEIQFGVLNASGPARCFIYLREPLAYDAMPAQVAALYSELHARDGRGRERASRLDKLKADLSARLPGRVRTYRAQWDFTRGRVIALDEWGRQVVNDIIAELETDVLSSDDTEISWQQVERRSLDDFVADRARDFVGRTEILDRLQSFAVASPSEGAPWGLSLTGEAGAGKSAIFSELLTRLSSQGHLVLAHAGGASPRARSIDAILLRWIEELAIVLGVDAALASNPNPDEIDIMFASLLGRAARQRHIVVMIDALDQLERTPRSRQMTWLPQLWPENARLIVTAIPCDATMALSKRAGILTDPIGPITRDEARQIITAICNRYHRTLEPEVTEALLCKEGPNGPPWGNTLWLELAVENLNVVDADDFERALKAYSGNPAEQLRALMVDRVAALPSDVVGVYLATIAHVEELFDAIEVRSFLGAIAVSRGGWRENDFKALLPRLAGLPWDELRFARLRRLFRGQIKQRGLLGQWVFTHTEMIRAVLDYLAQQEVRPEEIHYEIGEHLLSLPSGDPLKQSETMLHLLDCGEREQAARYYGDAQLTSEEVAGASAILAERVLEDGSREDGPGINAIEELLEASRTSAEQGALAHRLVFDLDNALALRVRLAVRRRLAEMARGVLARLTQSDPWDAAWRRDLSHAELKTGDVQVALGQLDKALECYQSSLRTAESLAQADPSNAQHQQDIAILRDKIGDVLVQSGQVTEALESYRSGSQLLDRLTSRDSANREWQRDLALSFDKIADVMERTGDVAEALSSSQSANRLLERLVTSDPANRRWQRDLAVSRDKIGNLWAQTGNLGEAMSSYREANRLFQRLYRSDPANTRYLRDLATSHNMIADVEAKQGNLAAALAGHRESLALAETLIEMDPADPQWQISFAVSKGKVADVLVAQGQLDKALGAYTEEIRIFERLAAHNPSHLDWLHNLSIAQTHVGDVMDEQGLPNDALKSYLEASEALRRLISLEPSNKVWERELGATLILTGHAQFGLGRMEQALENFKSSKAIFESLVRSDASNTGWQSDLALSCQKVGESLVKSGKTAEGLEELLQATSLRRKMAESASENAGWQINLAASLASLGQVYAAAGKKDLALQAFRSGQDILAPYAEGSPRWSSMFSTLERFIAELEGGGSIRKS
jgi:tetratricopeptide (TPR) repeat protein